MARDFQRGRVYRWEDKVVGKDPRGGEHVTLSIAECQKLARELTGEPECVAEPHRYRGSSQAKANASAGWENRCGKRIPVLTLPNWARKPWLVCHEAAHIVAIRDYRAYNHGPEYMKVYIGMLADMLGFNEAELRASAKEHGVKVAP